MPATTHRAPLHRRRRRHAAACILAALCLAAPAIAQDGSAQKLEAARAVCAGGGDADAQITACTTIIGSGLANAGLLSFAYTNRGIAWHARRRVADAMTDYDRAISLDPRNSFAFNNRGIAWHDEGDHERALADFATSIRLKPQDPRPYHNRGNLRRDRGELDLALADYTQAIRLDPNEPLALANRCVVRIRRGEDRSALADCNDAITHMQPSRLWPLQARAGALLLLEDRIGAERDIVRGTVLAPGDPWFRWLGALLHEQRGQEEAAQAERDAATGIDAAARRSFGQGLLNGARVEARLDPGRDYALPGTLACRDGAALDALVAAARRGAAPPPGGCTRQDVVFRPERALGLPPFPAEVVPLEAYGGRACERLSRRADPCALERRAAAAFLGHVRGAADGARPVAIVILDARVEMLLHAPAPQAERQRVAGEGGVPPGGAGVPGPGGAPGTGWRDPVSLMDGFGSGGYSVGLSDGSLPWPLQPPTTPPNGTATPR